MKLVKYNQGLRNHTANSFNNLVDQFFSENFDQEGTRSFVPRVDIAETEKAFELSLAVPGLKKEDFKLTFEQGQLTISGERKFNKEDKLRNFHKVETYFGSFSRSFHLPDSIIQDKIKASYENGILFVEVPKDEKKIIKRQIEVK